jgi:primosomal replication protein N
VDNRLVITGRVGRKPETRLSPAGVPLTRFPLLHESERTEAGAKRRVSCSVPVVASGEGLQATVGVLAEGCLVRVTGFLARAGGRSAEYTLVLHAQSVEPLVEVR